MKRRLMAALVLFLALAGVLPWGNVQARADKPSPSPSDVASPAPTPDPTEPPASFAIPSASPSPTAAPSDGGNPDLANVPIVVSGGDLPSPPAQAPIHLTSFPAHFLSAVHGPPVALIAWGLIALFIFLALASGMLIRSL